MNFDNIEVHHLTRLWMIRMIKGEGLTFEDLMPYSKISLRRSRMRKKFLKNPHRYISDKTSQIWLGCIVGNFSGSIFSKSFAFGNGFSLVDEDPENPTPKGNLFYLDYEYDNK